MLSFPGLLPSLGAAPLWCTLLRALPWSCQTQVPQQTTAQPQPTSLNRPHLPPYQPKNTPKKKPRSMAISGKPRPSRDPRGADFALSLSGVPGLKASDANAVAILPIITVRRIGLPMTSVLHSLQCILLPIYSPPYLHRNQQPYYHLHL